ncbi:ArnT family glycosyltransferase [Saccharicrinis aurantiacus]|uniref:ArnT family glycosyltransferase n=1 Tax=Saccharicrinis aurantiacus TaxID=1849719 RepID=UPI00094FD0E2|nr:glycosyltransferase family 39 protein [Saccharicrinis aurantiacus]
MNSKNTLFAVFTSIVIIYIIGLFPEVGIDSAKYAGVSRYIIDSGDWLHMHIYGKPYLQKPPFMFWLNAISFQIFGMSMFAFKLPTLLFTFASIFALFKFTKLYYSKNTGIIAAVMYASSQMLFLYHNDLHTDALMTANVVIGVSLIAHYLSTKQLWQFILGFVFIGFAVSTKGPIGLAVAAFAVGGHLLISKNWKQIFSPIWLLAIPILSLALFPTLKGLYDQFGWEGIKFFFWTNNAGRIAGSHGMNKDYAFYLHTLIYIYLPWSAYAFITFYNHIRSIVKNKKAIFNRNEFYTYSALLIFGSILSVSGQKAPHYLYPAIPFLTVIVADFINTSIAKNASGILKAFSIGRYIMLGLSLIVVILAVTFVFSTSNPLIWIVLLIGTILIIYILVKSDDVLTKLIIPLVISSLMLNFVLNYHFMPKAFSYHGAIRACNMYDELANDDELLLTYKYKQFETFFYAKNVSERAMDIDNLEKYKRKSNFWIITNQEGKSEVDSVYQDRISRTEIFKHKKISQMDGKFLNPRTRENSLKKIYLIKVE